MNTSVTGKKRGRPAKIQKVDNDHTDKDHTDSGDEEDSDEGIIEQFKEGGALALVVQNAQSLLEVPDFGQEQHMCFQTTQVAHMATLFKCLSNLLTRAEIIFHESGWRIVAKNSNKTAIVYLRVSEQTLAGGTYECNSQYRISVPLDDISHRMKIGRKADVMCFYLSGENPDKLFMKFSTSGRITEADLILCDPETEHPVIPPVVYYNQVDLPAAAFKEIVNEVKSDSGIHEITFIKYRHKFVIQVGADQGPIRFKFGAENTEDSAKFFSGNDEGLQEVKETAQEGEEKPLKSTFSLQEIINFTAISKTSKWVSLNMPEPDENGQITKALKISYTIAALAKISFYLVSKDEDDDE